VEVGLLVDLDHLLREATAAGASDIHLAVESAPILRVNGVLQRVGQDVLGVADAEAALRHLAAPGQLERFGHHGEADFSYSLRGVGRFRVSAFRQRGSVSLAIRPIPSRVPDLRELGAPDGVASLARREAGLVLVAGRAGSGKTMTIAAMVDLINTERALHVITLEDPVEFLHRHRKALINQREIGVDSLTFPQALRAAVRQNPDVVVVGDVQEAETASLVLTAAGTGHLVIANIRQPDCASALEYLVTLFPGEQQAQISWQLAAVLEGAVAQLLLGRKDGQGRVAAFEVLMATPAVRTLIREGKRQQITTLLRAGVRHGMRSMDQSWRELVERGLLDDSELPPFAVGGPGLA
jgi:twitching motility protein PilT